MIFRSNVQQVYEICAETLTLWHGGNLDKGTAAQKSGRWEYGPGLYLTTHYQTAKKYAKGSRKLYRIIIKQGTNLADAKIAEPKVKAFLDSFVINSKKKDTAQRLDKYFKNGLVDADIFLNIIINGEAIKNTDTEKLRQFLVENGADYSIVDNAFGWHERMIVLFNMEKIVSTKAIGSKDKIETFDLPTDFKKE